jgi:hypothetical protein
MLCCWAFFTLPYKTESTRLHSNRETKTERQRLTVRQKRNTLLFPYFSTICCLLLFFKAWIKLTNKWTTTSVFNYIFSRSQLEHLWYNFWLCYDINAVDKGFGMTFWQFFSGLMSQSIMHLGGTLLNKYIYWILFSSCRGILDEI